VFDEKGMPELFGLNVCQDGETGPGKCEQKRELCTTPRKKVKVDHLKVHGLQLVYIIALAKKQLWNREWSSSAALWSFGLDTELKISFQTKATERSSPKICDI
jgi:hypothetical protein